MPPYRRPEAELARRASAGAAGGHRSVRMWIVEPHEYFSFRQQMVLLFLAVIVLFLLYLRFDPRSVSPDQRMAGEIVVEVSGEVRSPGIYLFPSPPSLEQAIQRAGGLKETAFFDTGSSSVCLETGTFVSVEREKMVTQGGTRKEIKVNLRRMEPKKLIVFSIPLDLNRVTAEDLRLIPGIGESIAQEILSYRQRRKAFRSIEELKEVKTIGEKKYQSLKSYLTVRDGKEGL